MPRVSKKRMASRKNISCRYKNKDNETDHIIDTNTHSSNPIISDDSNPYGNSNKRQRLMNLNFSGNDDLVDSNFSASTSNSGDNPSFYNHICGANELIQLLSLFPCSNCYSENSNSITISSREFVPYVILTCKHCDSHMEHALNNSTLSTSIIQASSQIGIGQRQLNIFASIIGLPIINQRAYTSIFDKVFTQNECAHEELLKKSRQFVHDYHLRNGVTPNSDGCIEIAVSYDGSWMTKGFSSKYGIGAAIDIMTGLVIDISVLSRYCQKCNFKPKDKTQLEKWEQYHKKECLKTFSGSAPAMESSNAIILWHRSKEHGFIYKYMLSDGDSKTIANLNSEKPYGEDCQIIKRECINHVSKRFGTALRKIKKSSKIGGSGIGKLTESKIIKLTNYYGKAIRSNLKDIQSMKRNIYATLQHCTSTDKQPNHSWCPTGESSWCFYNRAQAKQQVPPKHSSRTFISNDVFKAIMPIYQRLSNSELLSRCLNGGTQNDNESFHHLLWTKCPKSKFCGLNKLKLGIFQAVSTFNHGIFHSFSNQLKHIGVKPNTASIKFFKSLDQKRLHNSARRCLEKSRRFLERSRKVKEEEEKKKAEGLTYQPGGF